MRKSVFQQILLGILFLITMYCGIIFLYMGEYLMSLAMGIVVAGLYIVGLSKIKEWVENDLDNNL